MEPELIYLQPPRLSRTRVHPAVRLCGGMEPDQKYHPAAVNADDALPVGQPSPPMCSSGTPKTPRADQRDPCHHGEDPQEQPRRDNTRAPGACPIPASEERNWAWLWPQYVKFRLLSRIKSCQATLMSQTLASILGTTSREDNAANNRKRAASDGHPHATTTPSPVIISSRDPTGPRNHQDSISTGHHHPTGVLSFWLGPTFNQKKVDKYKEACRRTRAGNQQQRSNQGVDRRMSSKLRRREVFGRHTSKKPNAIPTVSASKALKITLLQSLRDQAGAWPSGIDSGLGRGSDMAISDAPANQL